MELTQYQAEMLATAQFVGGLISMGIGYLVTVHV